MTPVKPSKSTSKILGFTVDAVEIYKYSFTFTFYEIMVFFTVIQYYLLYSTESHRWTMLIKQHNCVVNILLKVGTANSVTSIVATYMYMYVQHHPQ